MVFNLMRSFLVLIFFLLAPGMWLMASPLDDVSVNASLDNTSLYQGWPIKGTLEITHSADQKIDESNVQMDGKPLKISLLRNIKISPSSPLTVSIYQFTLPQQSKGSYNLAPISIKIDGKTYQTFSLPYEVQGPITLPTAPQGSSAENTLKLEAFVEGSNELYPGQTTKLVYRYVYQGNIALSKETLPMLEAKGLRKIGRNEIKNSMEGNTSIFEISQKVQALEPGEYSWGPSTIEGLIYIEDALGNKQFTTTQLSSEAPPVTLVVKAFPEKGKPASFNGAFGHFTFKATLLSPAKVSVGDPLNFDVAISGKTSNWESVNLPDLCCQPGFAGFFKMSDLPSIGKLEGETKHFYVLMHPLSAVIKNIPSIEFSYFDSSMGQYQVLYSQPIGLSVSPIQDLALVETIEEKKEEKTYEAQETFGEWLEFYKQLPPLDEKGLLSLSAADLESRRFGSWWILWVIPLCIVLLILLYKLRDVLKKRALKKQEKPFNKFQEKTKNGK